MRAVLQQISVPGHKVDGLITFDQYILKIPSVAVPANQIKFSIDVIIKVTLANDATFN